MRLLTGSITFVFNSLMNRKSLHSILRHLLILNGNLHSHCSQKWCSGCCFWVLEANALQGYFDHWAFCHITHKICHLQKFSLHLKYSRIREVAMKE